MSESEQMADADAGSASAEFDKFRAYVQDNGELADRLFAITDPEAFLEATLDAARTLGFEVEPDEVDAAQNRTRMEWQLRRVL